jgi:hypothetical protein
MSHWYDVVQVEENDYDAVLVVKKTEGVNLHPIMRVLAENTDDAYREYRKGLDLWNSTKFYYKLMPIEDETVCINLHVTGLKEEREKEVHMSLSQDGSGDTGPSGFGRDAE